MNNDDLFYQEREPEKREYPEQQYSQERYQQDFQNENDYNGNSYNSNGYNDYGYPQKKPANGAAIAALVAGLISMFCCFCPYISLPCAIAGIVTAIISRKNGGMRPMAIVGLITSIIGLLIGAMILIYAIYIVSHPELYQEIMEEYYRMLETTSESSSILRLFSK